MLFGHFLAGKRRKSMASRGLVFSSYVDKTVFSLDKMCLS